MWMSNNSDDLTGFCDEWVSYAIIYKKRGVEGGCHNLGSTPF